MPTSVQCRLQVQCPAFAPGSSGVAVGFFVVSFLFSIISPSCAVLSRLVVWDSATPWPVARQGPPSMGFSRQEYWSGLLCPPQGNLPHPGIEPRSPALRADSLPAEPPGKPMNTGVGSLSLLQGIFPTQEWNRSLRHCR